MTISKLTLTVTYRWEGLLTFFLEIQRAPPLNKIVPRFDHWNLEIIYTIITLNFFLYSAREIDGLTPNGRGGEKAAQRSKIHWWNYEPQRRLLEHFHGLGGWVISWVGGLVTSRGWVGGSPCGWCITIREGLQSLLPLIYNWSFEQHSTF